MFTLWSYALRCLDCHQRQVVRSICKLHKLATESDINSQANKLYLDI